MTTVSETKQTKRWTQVADTRKTEVSRKFAFIFYNKPISGNY